MLINSDRGQQSLNMNEANGGQANEEEKMDEEKPISISNKGAVQAAINSEYDDSSQYMYQENDLQKSGVSELQLDVRQEPLIL